MANLSFSDWTGIITFFSGWILFLLKVLYDRVDKFFLKINQWKSWLSNQTSLWDLDIEYTGRLSSVILKEIDSIVKKNFQSYSSVYSSHNSLHLLVDGININSRLTEETERVDGSIIYFSNLNIDFKDIRASFRETKSLIERIVSVLNSIDDRIKSVNKIDNKKYSATIKFKKNNPYFGLYVKRLKLKNIDSFTCVFDVSPTIEDSDKVLIGKDNICIASKKLTSFQSLSLKYLALS